MARDCLLLYCLGWLAVGCADRQHLNPLDPLSAETAGGVRFLEAVAGDEQVLLQWDYRFFEDVEGYRLYRRQEGEEFALYQEVRGHNSQFVDTRVENGLTYEYQLSLLVEGEGERRLEPVRRATPGSQVGWAADAGNGLVWKISADGRAAFFGQGRFPGLAGLAIDQRDGSCWVSDSFFRGVFRLGGDISALDLRPADLEEPGPVSIDSQEGIGWVIDQKRREVYWFPLAGADSLGLNPVDARFSDPAGLEAREGSCWIADESRVLRYWRDGTRQQWPGLERPGPVAAGWALVRGGQGLVRLGEDGNAREVELPFERGRAMEVDPASGACWVVGEEEVAALAPDGALLARWPGIGGGRGVAVDGVHQQVWIATPGALLKFAMTGELLARLEGFAGLTGIEVNPGKR